MNKKQWSALLYLLKHKAHTITGRSVPVLQTYFDVVGCTDGISIQIGEGEPYTTGLSLGAKISFYNGVFCHEVMHLVMTNFKVYQKHVLKYDEPVKNIFHTFFNIMEDGAIEHFAPRYIGGRLLNDLDFVNNVVYHAATPIDAEDVTNAYEQYLKAFIQFRIGGIIKGEFTFQDARKAFLDTITLWDKGIVTRAFKERLKIVDLIFEITRPLWNHIARDGNRAAEDLKDKMKKSGQSMTDRNGIGDTSDDFEKEESESGETEPGENESENQAKKEKQEKTIRKLKIAEESEKAGGSEKANTSEELDESEQTSGNGEGDRAAGEDEENADSGSSSAGGTGEDGESGTGSNTDSDGDDETEAYNPNDYEGAEANERELEKSVMEVERAAREAEAVESEIPTIAITNYGIKDVCKGVRCYDANAKYEEWMEDKYDGYVTVMKTQIKPLSSYLRRLFHNEREERVKKHAGKVNIKRLSKNNSARVFDKMVEPGNKSDTAIFMLVDESASMNSSGSMTNARLAAIGLAEALASVGCPLYVMGFTADQNSNGAANHQHYVKWKNIRRERVKLADMRPRANNFDSYSIRTAAEMLKKRSETHKMLIVISDGTPMCSAYDRGYRSDIGAEDTKLAIKDAEKVCSVFGVLVGNQDPKVHEYMYGNNLMHIKKPEELFSGISKQLRKIIKGW